jgi:hypothetical protein
LYREFVEKVLADPAAAALLLLEVMAVAAAAPDAAAEHAGSRAPFIS